MFHNLYVDFGSHRSFHAPMANRCLDSKKILHFLFSCIKRVDTIEVNSHIAVVVADVDARIGYYITFFVLDVVVSAL